MLVNPNWTRVSAVLADRGVARIGRGARSRGPHANESSTPARRSRHDDHQRGWTYFNLVLGEAGVALSDAADAALAGIAPVSPAIQSLGNGIRRYQRPGGAARAKAFGSQSCPTRTGRFTACFARLGFTDASTLCSTRATKAFARKPNARFFQLALDRVGADAATTIHVGNLFHVDVVGARAAGIEPVLLDIANCIPTRTARACGRCPSWSLRCNR